MEVTFYLPEKYLPDATRQAAWKEGTLTALEGAGKAASAQSWIYQTWLELQKAGRRVRLAHEVPREGILVTLSGCVGRDFRPGPGLFFADIVADYFPHPGARLHIVQNAAHARTLRHAEFMPHWPQPGLCPRDAARGERFENVHFFGDAGNLAGPLRDARWWDGLSARLGIHFSLCGADRWHDFRETDCALAVREFGRQRFLNKPATKLYNAWLAGVPFIGGCDSAYEADGTPGTDFLAVDSPDALAAALEMLARDPARRAGLVRHGRLAAQHFTREAVISRWQRLVDSLPERAVDWQRLSRASRRWALACESAALWWDRVRR